MAVSFVRRWDFLFHQRSPFDNFWTRSSLSLPVLQSQSISYTLLLLTLMRTWDEYQVVMEEPSSLLGCFVLLCSRLLRAMIKCIATDVIRCLAAESIFSFSLLSKNDLQALKALSQTCSSSARFGERLASNTLVKLLCIISIFPLYINLRTAKVWTEI